MLCVFNLGHSEISAFSPSSLWKHHSYTALYFLLIHTLPKQVIIWVNLDLAMILAYVLRNGAWPPKSWGPVMPRPSSDQPWPLPGRCQCEAALPQGIQLCCRTWKSSKSKPAFLLFYFPANIQLINIGTNRSTNLLKKSIQNWARIWEREIKAIESCRTNEGSEIT